MEYKSRLHPMLWVAALSVTAASTVAIGSMTGLLQAQAEQAPAVIETTKSVEKVEANAEISALPAAAGRHAVREEPIRLAQYSGGTSYGGIPVNRGTRADGTPVGSAPAPQAPRYAPPAQRCSDCGTVESVRAVTREGDGSGVGAVAGGVVGGALGNGVGQGHGRTLATIAGAVGGAMLGNKVEKDQKKTTVYESTIRMEDGSRRTVTSESHPAWQQGDTVQVDHGTVIPR